MPNMSYCRFENTLDDLAECVDAMLDVEEGDKPTLSLNEHELRAFHFLADQCRYYLELYAVLSENESKLLPRTDDDE